MDKNEHQELLHRFWNVTLLGQEYNCKAKNKGFKQKEALSQCSEIPITKDLVKHTTWTRQEIETRQEELANIALDILKRN